MKNATSIALFEKIGFKEVKLARYFLNTSLFLISGERCLSFQRNMPSLQGGVWEGGGCCYALFLFI